MFTILWKTPNGGEELFAAASIALMQEAPSGVPPAELEKMDCHGRRHVSFCYKDVVEKQPIRTTIDVGAVYVMNAEGRTVATYRF